MSCCTWLSQIGLSCYAVQFKNSHMNWAALKELQAIQKDVSVEEELEEEAAESAPEKRHGGRLIGVLDFVCCW